MENNITAEKFWEEKYELGTDIPLNIMVAFAKLHCEAQLKAILENVRTKDDPYSYTGNTGSEYPPDVIVDEDSIINAYDLNQIK
jgi:hypothetical protein